MVTRTVMALQGPLKTLDSDCSKEEKQYAEWVTVRARVALLEVCLCAGRVPMPRTPRFQRVLTSRQPNPV